MMSNFLSWARQNDHNPLNCDHFSNSQPMDTFVKSSQECKKSLVLFLHKTMRKSSSLLTMKSR
ncbi:hypothetical protein HID58_090924 [Brassica napus]|uniref:Uncharacterized protein n=1 Tax=Brassica napus TaxID=3708 RepID=A0ABQ7X8M3_BRANA|nr:hypothetical protein HID58_090924 [Brassica napus]